MPFDNTNTKPDLSTPTLEGLSYLLRHQERWSNFTWDFRTVEHRTECGTAGCAIGLAMQTWESVRLMNVSERCNVFGLTSDDMGDIFFNSEIYGVQMKDVTHTMVADKIDEYLRCKR